MGGGRELIDLERKTSQIRGNLEKSSRGDFINDQSRSPDEIGKQKAKPPAQYQKYGDSGIGTVSYNERRNNHFPTAPEEEFGYDSQQEIENRACHHPHQEEKEGAGRL